ncbi:MAG: SOS response-associated peptidase [Pirellulaceae bacterium]
MCGRFTLKTPPDQWVQLLLPIANLAEIKSSWQPRYNIAPTQNIVAFAMNDQQEIIADYYRWGLIPSWATDLSIGSRMINARSETLQEKRSFKGPLAKRRCLIVADGYYEWQKRSDGSKQPHWIHPTDADSDEPHPLILFAGLWEHNRRATNHPIRSCTIITTAANSHLEPIHDRMPAILSGQAAQRWLSDDCTVEEAQAFLQPAPPTLLRAQSVSTHVNNARHEDPNCLK